MNLLEAFSKLNENIVKELLSKEELANIFNECLNNVCDVYPECSYELKEYVRFVGVKPQDACGRCSIFSYHCLTPVPECIEISIDNHSAAKIISFNIT